MRLARDCAYGLIAGLFFGALLLVFNIGDLWMLSRHSPLAVALVMIFAAIAFEPAIFCSTIAAWRRGRQDGPDRSETDEL